MNEAYTLLLCHFVGDYYLQSDWMALNKNKKTLPCLVHVLLYTLCFLPFVSWPALAVIGITHFLIDRFGFIKRFIWLKNHLNPTLEYPPYDQCKLTGYYDKTISEADAETLAKFGPGRPFHLTLMLYIVSDNTLHLICNELARVYFPLP